MNYLNYDLKLQLVNYLNENFITAWFKLLQINKSFYQVYLYNLRKSRYILTANEINEFVTNNLNNIDKKLLDAAKNGYFQIVKYLISNGANINAVNMLGQYVLSIAVIKGYLPIVKYIILKGANIHRNNNELLQYAVQKGHLNIIKYLVEHGANINAKSIFGGPMFKIEKGKLKSAELEFDEF